MTNENSPTCIYSRDGLLTFDSTDEDSNLLPLAVKDEYELGDRCVGSIFEALEPEEHVKLADGCFVLDDELDLVQDWSIA